MNGDLDGKSKTTAILLNIVPGLGCLYVGRPVIAGLGLSCVLVCIALTAIGSWAFGIGVLVTAACLLASILTVGLSLLFLPVGIVLMLFGAGPIIAGVIWLIAMAATMYVSAKAFDDGR